EYSCQVWDRSTDHPVF
nr:immunoglobulin light chain junction region [Macaca mulatta]MOX70204.1 immunoglobulin light chain junction region [Macaca mulatta]MOX70282.1 immunoglobulin light chain junction region [Macaca mulatta]MOX70383.1 immunoglobulin light chain junction region [Macaca mulatta]MOX71443.1 immunoglobulin light chain junction region [Macaca mulatta]